MPEIWLPYGDVEIVLSLKAEQLSQEIKVEDGEVNLDEMREKIKSLEFDFNRGLIVLDEGPYSVQILDLTIGTLGLKPSDIRLLAPAKTWRVLERRGFKRPSSGYFSLGIVDGCRITAPLEVESGTLVISEVGFDVLYGFKGPWSAICNSLDLKEEVWKRKEDKITPGLEDGGSWFSKRVLEEVSPLTISYISGSSTFSSLFIGEAEKAGKELISILNERRVKIKPHRLAIICAGGDPFDSTLSNVLRAACLHLKSIQKGGEIVIVGECSEGLGSTALEMLFEGRPIPSTYVDGMEDLECIKALKEKGDIYLVTALPSSMLKRIGLDGYRSLSNTFSNIQSRHGWRLKALVIAHASLTLTEPLKV